MPWMPGRYTRVRLAWEVPRRGTGPIRHLTAKEAERMKGVVIFANTHLGEGTHWLEIFENGRWVRVDVTAPSIEENP